MPQVMVRYRIKPDRVAENERLVRAVYDELDEVAPAGLRYATFRLEDGVSFMHLALSDAGPAPLQSLQAFRRFRESLPERWEAPLARSVLSPIGSYRV
jgi:hypothetical protein